MANKSTLPPKWKALADAMGGVENLRRRLDVSYMTLYRMARGISRIPGPTRELLERLAGEYKVPIPVTPKIDLEPLELLGAALAEGQHPKRAIEHIRKQYPEELLIELAELDGVSDNVLRAVAELLGL